MKMEKKIVGDEAMKIRLSALWIFAILNYLYCDVVGLMDSSLLAGFLAGNVGGMRITEDFLLGASVLMEISIAMTLLSRLLCRTPNRWANIGAGSLMTIIQSATLFLGTKPTGYYIFFSVIEISCTAAIVWQALTWAKENTSSGAQAV